MNKMLKQENGITLVTLVITMIITALLAAATAFSIVREDGLISRTRNVQNNYTKQEKSADERVERIHDRWGDVINKTGIDNQMSVTY